MKTRFRRVFGAAAIVASTLLAAPSASADDKATAANFFEAGAAAYDAGEYLVAAEAFLKAHELLKSPALVFSAAQAYRRQYLVDASPDALRRAVRLYRDYLRDDPAGKRHEDAVLALADLVPLEARLPGRRASLSGSGAPDPGGKPGLVPIDVPLGAGVGNGPPVAENPAEEPVEAPRTTRLLITTNPTNAEVSVDGKPFQRGLTVVEVEPKTHVVRVRAPGYHDEEASVEAVKNELVPRHVVLRPKPGRLLVTGTSGARLAIDGQVRAALPMDGALEIEPGEHFIAVTRAGRATFGKTVTVERDGRTLLDVDLPMTGQRVAAWTAFGAGLAGAIAGGVLTGLMLERESAASALEERRTAGTLTVAERESFNAALTARNELAVAAGITGGAAALTLLTSAGLFLFDEPDVLPAPAKRRDEKNPAPRVEFTVGLSSAAVRVAF
jgi:hypothetical protein